MAHGIGNVSGQARNLERPQSVKTTEKFHLPSLPAADGSGWGREVSIKRLNVQEQIALLSRIRDGIRGDREMRGGGSGMDEQGSVRLELRGLDMRHSDEESGEFWESAYLLTLGSIEPTFTIAEATQWLSSDEIDGINCSDVVQALLVRIRNLNAAPPPGMEDLVGGVNILNRLPMALHAVEQAYLKGGDALDLLLEGKAPGSQEEMARFIENWGAIISSIAFRVLAKQAKLQADENAEAMLAKIADFAVQVGALKREDQ